MFSLREQVAVVTGAANGIGKECSVLFAQVGAKVIVVDRDQASAEEVAQSIRSSGAHAWAFCADISREQEVEELFERVSQREGQLDVLVNNAGIAIRAPATELSLQDWQRVLDVNLTGVFLCARTAARHMAKRPCGGAIVNTASIMGLSGGGIYPNISYQATKGAVVNLTRALAVEWAERSIRVNAVAPTYVKTSFISGLLANPEIVARINRMTPMGRMAESDEVAASILFLASKASSMTTGHTLPVDGGFLAQ
jgi:NAD(P)-dependent dehydrogenase (short-subunit alcohol dehydrogenase family)